VSSPIALRAGSTGATIHPDPGGRIGQLDLGGGPVLRGPEPGLGWAAWGCYPLLPWSNRIPDGHLVFGAIDARLPINWPDRSAIHGLVASCAWTVVSSSAQRAELVVEAEAAPYRVRGHQTFVLEPGRLHLALSVVSLGDARVPVGLGIHPWFRAGPVRLPATLKWPGDPIPVGEPVALGRDDDLRSPRVPPIMDRCFTGLTDRSADVPGVRLSWEGPITQLVVYSGTPGWVAVEPVTMANDGFGLAHRGTPGHGVQILDPTKELSVTYHFERR
jgi:aldose 1-epimerase